jgi:hypothetical protein
MTCVERAAVVVAVVEDRGQRAWMTNGIIHQVKAKSRYSASDIIYQAAVIL